MISARQRGRIRHLAFVYALLFPAMFFVIGILGYAVISALWTSLHQVHALQIDRPFVGLRNYVELFGDRNFVNSVQRSLIFVVGSVSLGLLIALVAGWNLFRIQRFNSVPRAFSLIPYLVSGIAAAVTWRFMFAGDAAVVNMITESLGGNQISWLGHRDRALFVVMLANTWRISPFAVLVILSGFQSIDADLLDAAEIDGATGLARFRYVALPLIAPMVSISLIWLSFASFNMFDIVMAMTGGGPQRGTEFMAVHLYKLAFERLDYSAAAAVMILLLLINTLVSIGSLRASKV
jgi:ABC-type sugar transport system permease subunit